LPHVFLSRWWANWQRGLIIVQPATVLRWRRRGFWAIWGSGSCRRWRGGPPRISGEVRRGQGYEKRQAKAARNTRIVYCLSVGVIRNHTNIKDKCSYEKTNADVFNKVFAL
jgi:hypothetical protein